MFGLSDIVTKLILYAVGALVLLGIVTGVYFNWKGSIRDKALEDFNKKQVEQVMKDSEELRIKMSKVVKDQQDIIKSKDDQIKNLESKISEIEDYLDSADVKKADRPASEILKNTVRKLKGTISK